MTTYRVNEIFYSLQGEGRNVGRAAVFIRFSGCNLSCPFCDTDFFSYREMSLQEILSAIEEWPSRLMVLTGGEPTLQVDSEMVDTLHSRGYEIAMESNGTHLPPEGIDWLTVSPKSRPVVTACDELKCIFRRGEEPRDYGIRSTHRYLQPCDEADRDATAANIAACIEYIKTHPSWTLSLQTHKMLGIR